MVVAILGISEAGGTLARDWVLVADNATAVRRADMVLSVNWAS